MPELNIEKYKKLIKYMFSNFKVLETELMIYRMAFLALKIVEPNRAEFLDQTLGAARNSPALQTE